MKIGLLHSLIRKEEKLLIEAFRNAGVEPIMIDDRKLIMDFHTAPDIDILVERSINHSRALHALRLFESAGVCCVNTHKVAQICGDKLLTTAALKDHGVAQPQSRVAFTEESALEAIEELGYPVVLKPAVGSWGRLLSKINDRDAAETVLEHKTVLGSYHHSIFYIQQYIEKQGAIFAASLSATIASRRSIVARITGSPTPPAALWPANAKLQLKSRRYPWPRPKRLVAASSRSTCLKATPVCWSMKSTTPWNFATASIPPVSIFPRSSLTTSSVW